jgi:DegV family protein with EDD domain
MRIGLVVDSSCDLPRSFFDDDSIELMPTTLKMGDQTFEDRRNERQTIIFYSRQADQNIDVNVESFPYSSEQIEQLFLDKLVNKYDQVICLTVTQSRSSIYENAMRASIGILGKYQKVRSDAGLDNNFSLAVINSRNIFTGTAVLAAEVIRMIKSGSAPSVIDSRIREMVPHTYCYMVPPDLEHIYKHASKRGDKSINWTSFMLGSMLDIKPILLGHRDETRPVAKMRRFDNAVETMLANATRAVEAGLLAPGICIGYGGDPAVVQDMPGFQRLNAAAAKAGVAIHIAPMSITAGAFTGPGCLTVSFISDKHIFEEKV